MDETPPDAEERQRFKEAVNAGRHSQAIGAMSSGLMRQLIHLLKERGFEIEFQREPANSIEFFGGIAATLDKQIEKDGEDAAFVLRIGRELSSALLGLQTLLHTPFDESRQVEDVLAESLLQAMMVGACAEHLGLTTTGHFDEFARLKLEEIKLREKQRLAAEATNESRRQPKRRAIEEAQRICATNPTLTNEDLALKARQAASLNTTLKTVTDWMRKARLSGQVPPRKGR